MGYISIGYVVYVKKRYIEKRTENYFKKALHSHCYYYLLYIYIYVNIIDEG